MDRRWIVLLAMLASTPAADAVSKCRDAEGGLVYVQSRICPVDLVPLEYDPPPLNRMSVTTRSVSAVPKESPRPKRTPDPLLPKCRGLKDQFEETDRPCRGARDCRARFHRRQALREQYQSAFCAVRTGAIDS